MAYRFKGAPKWEDLLSIYGTREPVSRVIVVSSDDSDDNGNGCHATVVPDEVDARLTPLNNDPNRPPSMLSRNMQRSMWEYIGYASDSDEASIDGYGSSANSRKDMRKIREARKKKEEATTLYNSRVIGGSAGSSLNNSSCASNDPYGKRNM